MLLETDAFRTSGHLPAKLQAYHDFREQQRQERITVPGQIRLAPRRTERQAEHDRIAKRRKPPHKIIRGAKREHVVQQLSTVLKSSKFSRFEHEGSCHHGVRAVLCLDGEDWHEADAEAASLLGEAFQRIGASRPTYDEGQREYATGPHYCSWCLASIENASSRAHLSFCSAECARSAMAAREIGSHRYETRAFEAAWNTIARSRNPLCECEECHNNFRPLQGGQRFCSERCWHENRARLLRRPERTCPTCSSTFHPATAGQVHCSPECGFASRRTVVDRPCEHCGTVFRPASNADGGRFCSRACKHAHGLEAKHHRECQWCGQHFAAKMPKAHFCSNACGIAERRFKLGVLPHALGVHVFDHFVTLAAIAPPLPPRKDSA